MAVTKKSRSGPGRLTAEDAARVPDRLMDAAMQLFLEHGYGQTTMNEIAKRAGASTKTLYSRFPGKSDILQAVLQRIMERMIQVHGGLRPADALLDDPRAYLITWATWICSRIATDGVDMHRLALSEAQRFSEFLRLHELATGQGKANVAIALGHWRAQGLLPLMGDIERTAILCLSMTTDWVRVVTSLGAPPGKAEIDDRVAFAVDHFLKGCGYDPARKPAAARMSEPVPAE